MRITGIKQYDYNELQRLRKNLIQNSNYSRKLQGPIRVEALRRVLQDARLYESSRAKLTQTFPEALVDFLPICVAHKGKVIYIPFL